ncbi:hypothetical protein BWI17_04120 [Betaproteobacteria bacterium GR16-43]|nr:hypothetical protein BWI17_04120 [Betaproteobacteria bacterium GR16-43]
MNTMKPFAVVAIIAFAATLAACQKEGPMEKAGKKVDNAVEKAGEKIEKAGDKIKDATSK